MNYLRSLCLAAMLAFGLSAHAEDNARIGYVKTLSGDANIVSGETTSAARVGSALKLGDRIITGANASLGLILKDNTVLSLGPDTEISVDDYLYAPAREALRLDARILRGTLHYISGVIAKLKPEAVTVRTPTGTIGVRGTRFVVKVAD
ncbi:FecR family protein [Azoarcus sp. TTM-91]|uniref:FecR family protein n=1 Tax=Azoarcus sp. TTM-91 TaxID=2691581 RepID=UPI001B7CDE0D|nr:FecR family protein [Azoarcus sp. TTM-91]